MDLGGPDQFSRQWDRTGAADAAPAEDEDGYQPLRRPSSPPRTEPLRHVNFFTHLERHTGPNRARELEKKAELEREQKLEQEQKLEREQKLELELEREQEQEQIIF